MENTAFIALGSNIGNRYDNMMNAISQLTGNKDIQLVNCSSIYETDPVGYEDQDLFLNMVIQVTTDLSPYDLLDRCLSVELLLGRKRKIRWGPRTLDLDILLYNQETIETEKLEVPHPRMLERAFVMVPLLELNPDLRMFDEEFNTAWLTTLPKEGVRLWKRKNGEDVSEPIGN